MLVQASGTANLLVHTMTMAAPLMLPAQPRALSQLLLCHLLQGHQGIHAAQHVTACGALWAPSELRTASMPLVAALASAPAALLPCRCWAGLKPRPFLSLPNLAALSRARDPPTNREEVTCTGTTGSYGSGGLPSPGAPLIQYFCISHATQEPQAPSVCLKMMRGSRGPVAHGSGSMPGSGCPVCVLECKS